MLFGRKKRIQQKLESSFGQLKTEGFNFEQIKRYNANKDNSSAFQELTDQTINDLDFELFFCFVDRTTSKPGQQFLYDRLRTIEPHKRDFQNQEKVIQYLEENASERLKIQYELNKLNHQQAYYIVDLFQKELDKKPKWYFLFPLLSITVILSIVLSFFNPNFVIILLGVIPINVLIHYGLKRKTNVFLNSIPSLLSMGPIARRLSTFPVIKDYHSDINSSIKVVSAIGRKMSFFKLEQKVDSDMEAAYWFLLELIKITFLLEPLLLFSSLDTLRDKTTDIESVFCFIGEVDCMVSILSLRQQERYCVPVIDKSGHHIQFEDLRHPLVPNCVSNSTETSKSILLTGSNMSGKTTFIRAIGLNYISGMALNTCFASSARLPCAKLHSVIRIEDDLMSSSSYFYKEVYEIRKIIRETEKEARSIILLDELFKGTNTIERIASAKAVLSYLETKECQIFAATHDIELTELLKSKFELFHFTECIKDSNIHFDYILKKGVPSSGNAVKILELNNFPRDIVREANALVSQMK